MDEQQRDHSEYFDYRSIIDNYVERLNNKDFEYIEQDKVIDHLAAMKHACGANGLESIVRLVDKLISNMPRQMNDAARFQNWSERFDTVYAKIVEEAKMDDDLPPVQPETLRNGDSAADDPGINKEDKLKRTWGDQTTPPKTIPLREAVILMNHKYAVCDVKGKFRILCEKGDTEILRTKEDFFNFMANKFVTVTRQDPHGREITETKELGLMWFRHEDRLEFSEYVFDPSKPHNRTPPTYNSYRGFRCAPSSRGSCTKYLAYIKDVLLSGDEKHYGWFIAWHAQILQQPWLKLGSAICLQGLEGIGKTFHFDHFSELIDGDARKFNGRYCAMYDDQEQLFEKFNLHIHQKLLIGAEEAIYAGSAREAAKLRSMVTRTRMHVRPMHHEGWEDKDYARYMILGNAEHLIHASPTARRYFIVTVSDAHRKNQAYWDEIEEEWQNGGREAFMHYLMNFDISKYNLRRAPGTSMLNQQKDQSLDLYGKFLKDVLQDGVLAAREFDGTSVIERNAIFALLELFRKESGISGKITKEGLGIALSKYLAGVVIGMREPTGDRRWLYKFERLDKCRQCWSAYMEYVDYEWDESDGWTEHEMIKNGKLKDAYDKVLAEYEKREHQVLTARKAKAIAEQSRTKIDDPGTLM